jgi:hypothetical protein
MDILNESKGFENVNVFERQFTNKFGNTIKEDIIIVKKSQLISKEMNARKIACFHLENCLRNTNNGIHDDVVNAIQSLDEIEHSPIFNVKNVIINE